jgi:hypothetical protein
MGKIAPQRKMFKRKSAETSVQGQAELHKKRAGTKASPVKFLGEDAC